MRKGRTRLWHGRESAWVSSNLSCRWCGHHSTMNPKSTARHAKGGLECHAACVERHAAAGRAHHVRRQQPGSHVAQLVQQRAAQLDRRVQHLGAQLHARGAPAAQTQGYVGSGLGFRLVCARVAAGPRCAWCPARGTQGSSSEGMCSAAHTQRAQVVDAAAEDASPTHTGSGCHTRRVRRTWAPRSLRCRPTACSTSAPRWSSGAHSSTCPGLRAGGPRRRWR